MIAHVRGRLAAKSADRVVKENLKIHRYSSTPLEPFVVIASYDAASQRLTLYCHGE